MNKTNLNKKKISYISGINQVNHIACIFGIGKQNQQSINQTDLFANERKMLQSSNDKCDMSFFFLTKIKMKIKEN